MRCLICVIELVSWGQWYTHHIVQRMMIFLERIVSLLIEAVGMAIMCTNIIWCITCFEPAVHLFIMQLRLILYLILTWKFRKDRCMAELCGTCWRCCAHSQRENSQKWFHNLLHVAHCWSECSGSEQSLQHLGKSQRNEAKDKPNCKLATKKISCEYTLVL